MTTTDDNHTRTALEATVMRDCIDYPATRPEKGCHQRTVKANCSDYNQQHAYTSKYGNIYQQGQHAR
jgi:hypothetical protein